MHHFDVQHASELIRRARKDAGLTPAELGGKSGLGESRLTQVEAGTRTVSAALLERVLGAADYRPSLALEDQADAIHAAARRRGFTNVRVFGSVLRGEDGFDSDIDLLVTPNPGADLFDVALFADEVRQLTGFRVDVVSDAGTSQFVHQVIRQAVPL